jgi:hypothetical protein
MARKPLFSIEMSEGGMQRVFDAFYRKGSMSADIQLLFRQGSGLKIGSAPTKKIKDWLIRNSYLSNGRGPNQFRIDGYWKPKEVAKQYYDFVMGIGPKKPELVVVPKITVVKETIETQEIFSDATGFPLKWMKTEVYFIKDGEFNHGTVTGFRTLDDMEGIELQIDCTTWIPKQIAYNSLEDFKNMIGNKLKKL